MLGRRSRCDRSLLAQTGYVVTFPRLRSIFKSSTYMNIWVCVRERSSRCTWKVHHRSELLRTENEACAMGDVSLYVKGPL